MHFISGNPWNNSCKSVDITFKNRHMPEFIPGKLTHLGNSEYVIESANKVQGIAPGQFAVIYDKDSKLCYGSGIITGQNVVL
jgi:tRNA-specific 2-thiouridylase